jgi:hypothetical protein
LEGAREVIWPDEKLIELDSRSFSRDWERVLAHAIAHLDLHLDDPTEELSRQQCRDATFLADVRLDREGSR